MYINELVRATRVILTATSMLTLGMLPGHAQDFTHVGSEKPVTFSGGMQARSFFYNASGILGRQDPFSYVFDGNATVSLYGWNIPFSFTYSQQDKSFRQPFNQFGMSPRYKWVTLHGGYRNLNFSPYTLAGHTMLGGGVELNPGKLRFAVMYGRLNRATVIDTTMQTLVPFSFSRKGFAAKLGYGTPDNHFELSFLKAQDDSSSRPLDVIPDGSNVLAASNAVLGYKTKFTILKKAFVESDGAVSVYTNDINSPLTVDSLDNPILESLRNSFNLNGTSQLMTALNVGMGYAERYYRIKVNYQRVEPNFRSMGAYYFSNDLEAYTVNPTFSLPSGKLRGNASIGIQRDNIKNQKEATNKRFVGTANIAAQFTERLGLDFNYSNFSNNQTPKTLNFADSMKIVQTTQVFSFMPRYLIVTPKLTHMVMVSANLSGMKDFNGYFGAEEAQRDIRTNQYLLSYTVSIPAKRVSVFTNINYTELEHSRMRDKYQGVSLGGNYSTTDSKGQVGINGSVMQGIAETSGKSLIINASLNAAYRVTRHHSLRTQLFVTNNNPGTAIIATNPAFTETRGELAYQFTF